MDLICSYAVVNDEICLRKHDYLIHLNIAKDQIKYCSPRDINVYAFIISHSQFLELVKTIFTSGQKKRNIR